MKTFNRDIGMSKKIIKNSFALMSAKVVDMVFGLLTMSIIARYLGAGGFGNYAFILSIAAVTSPLADMGLKRILTREISRDRDNAGAYLGTALFLIGIISAFLLVTGIGVVAFTWSGTLLLILLTVLSKIFVTYETVFTGVFNAHEKMGYEVVVVALRKTAFLLMLLIVVFFLKQNIMGIISVMVLSNLVSAVYAYFVTKKKFLVPRINVRWDMCRDFIRESYPLGIYAFILVMFQKVDIFFLKSYRSDYEIGLYQAASQFVIMWNIIPVAITSSLFPSFSKFAATDMEKFAAVYKKSFNYLIIMGLAILIAILYLAEEIILIIYGKDFIAGTHAMRIFALALPLIFFNIMLSTVLTAVKKQMYNMIAATACLSLNIVLDIILIQRFGYISAAYASLVSFALMFLLKFHFVRKFAISLSLVDLMLKPILSVIVPVLLLFVLKGSPIFYLLPSMIIYFLSLLLLKVISVDDVTGFKRMLLRS